MNETNQKLIHVRRGSGPKIQGRREFFEYLDHRAKEGSVGLMNAQTMVAIRGMTEPTGWHYHECDCQFLYILGGWIDMEFETGDRIRLNEGDSLYIPGRMRHNETATSDDMELLEVSIPSVMGTVPCSTPQGMSDAD